MMRICLLSLWAGLLAAGSLSASTIQFQITDLGINSDGDRVDRYTYLVNDLTLLKDAAMFTALDIQFDPALVSTLSNPVAGNVFQTLLLQPNTPLGTPGDFFLMTASGNAPVSEPFSIDFTFLGPGVPGAQQFFVKQFDQNGNFLGTLESGSTSPAGQVVPEPANFAMGGVALAIGFMWWAVRIRLASTV